MRAAWSSNSDGLRPPGEEIFKVFYIRLYNLTATNNVLGGAGNKDPWIKTEPSFRTSRFTVPSACSRANVT